MNWRITTSIFILSVLSGGSLFAQQPSGTAEFRDLFRPEAVTHDYSLKIDTKNEFRLVLSTGFAFYKLFVSSQDAVRCTFHPSCSVYAVESIRTNGVLGVLDAIDRLTRCNGISPEKYTFDTKTQLLYDPVRKIRHKAAAH